LIGHCVSPNRGERSTRMGVNTYFVNAVNSSAFGDLSNKEVNLPSITCHVEWCALTIWGTDR